MTSAPRPPPPRRSPLHTFGGVDLRTLEALPPAERGWGGLKKTAKKRSGWFSPDTPHEDDAFNLFRASGAGGATVGRGCGGGGGGWCGGFSMTATAEQELKDKAHRAFMSVVRPGATAVEASVAVLALRKLGLTSVDEEELFVVMDKDSSTKCAELSYPDFLQVLMKCLARQDQQDDQNVATWVALGGNSNRTGLVSVAKLRRVMYSLRIPICVDEVLTQRARQRGDEAPSYLEFADFCSLFADEGDAVR